MDCFIVRYGEIGLKGGNRGFFEEKLVKNIIECLRKNNKKYSSIKRVRGRILIYSEEDLSCLSCVFGITSFSAAIELEWDIEIIKRKCLSLVSDEKSFAVKARRADKRFKMSSIEIQRDVGAYILENKDIKVNLGSPKITVYVEILKDRAYVYSSFTKGAFGLPVGSGGRVLSLVENNLLASLLFMKRGCDVYTVGFEKKDISLLEKYGNYNSFTTVCDFFELEKIALQKRIDVLVVDQNLESFTKIKTKLTVMRPLIAYDSGFVLERLCFFDGN